MLQSLAVLVLIAVPTLLVRDLGSPRYPTRERASRELWKLGRTARPALAAARLDPDPEVRSRAAAILEKFDWGIYPDTPAEVRKLIHQFRTGEPDQQTRAIDELLRLNDLGLDALTAILARDFPQARREELFRHLSRQARKAVPTALFAARPDFAERLLRIVALGGEPDGWADYAMLMKVRDRLPAAERTLIGHAKTPGPRGESARAALGWVQVLSGRPAEAATTVRKLAGTWEPDAELTRYLTSVHEEAGQWKALAAELGNGSDGLMLFRLQRDGDQPTANMRAQAMAEASGPEASRAVAVELLLSGYSRTGLDLIRRFPNDNSLLLADLLAARGEFVEALKRFDGPDDTTSPLFVCRLRSQHGFMLARLGHHAKADAAFKKAADNIWQFGDRSDQEASVSLIRSELRAGRVRLADAHAAWLQDRYDRIDQKDGWSPSLFDVLFESDAEAARGWWTALRKHGPDEEPADSIRRVREQLDGTASKERTAFAARALDAWHEAVHRADYPNPDDRMRLAVARAAAARVAGDLDAVEHQLSLAVVSAGQSADDHERGPRSPAFGTDERFRVWQEYGDLLMERSKPMSAATAYLDGWQWFPDNPILMYLSGRALLTAGDVAEGERRIAVAHQVPLGNARVRGRFLAELCVRGRANDLRRERDLTRATVWYWEPDRANVWNAVVRASVLLKDYPAAADAVERHLNCVLRYNAQGGGGGELWANEDGARYLEAVAGVRAYSALSKLTAGEGYAAMVQALEYHALLPTDPEFMIRLVREFDARGEKAGADLLFRLAWDKFQGLIAEYPASAWAKASAAELAAGCQRELDAALELARSAVALDPDSRAATEALAEVRFRRGERAEAVRLMGELAKRWPRERAYRRQLERYTNGDANSEPPDW